MVRVRVGVKVRVSRTFSHATPTPTPMTRYIHFAKLRINPKLTEEASKRITMLYADLRAKVAP